jgi:ubiquinone/menaquinone biosynthesis C-methylase UbiE
LNLDYLIIFPKIINGLEKTYSRYFLNHMNKNPEKRQVADLYNKDPHREWMRLEKDAYHSLEFSITMHYLQKHIPSGGRVLDAGGGPGRYTLELCRLGYQVTLLDLSEGNLALAREKLGLEPEVVQENLSDMNLGDIRDLSRYQNDSFDVVLCLGGVLSHIPEQRDRETSLAELVRVAKHPTKNSGTFGGGIVAINVIGYLAVLRDCMKYWSDELTSEAFPVLLETGNITGTTGTPWHFYRAEEIKREAESAGLETLEVLGCEGLGAGLEEAVNELALDEPKWKQWVDLSIKTANENAVADTAEHILYIGRVK